MEITSKQNARVKQWQRYAQRKYRDQDHMFLVEGMHLVEEAHQAGIISCIITKQGFEHPYMMYEHYEVSEDIMHKISASVSGSDIIAQVHYPKPPQSLGKRVVLLDDVQDPGNAGTIIRSALSFGFDAVIFSQHSVDLYNEKLIRSTQGALFHIPVIKADLKDMIAKLKAEGFMIYATDLKASKALSGVQPHERSALIFGNEGNGVSKEVLSMSDQNIIIEMHTFESLNVAVAAGICMYHFYNGEQHA